MSGRPLRVTFVVPDLRAGGAERHVVTLVEHLDPTRFDARVVCLGEEGALFADAAAHVPATAFGLRKRQAVRALLRLVRELRRHRTDVVVTNGYNAETLGRLAAVLARVPRRVVWVHNCDDLAPQGRVRRVVDALLEPVTDAYFGVAERQRPYLVDTLGRPDHKIRIIHNGVDPSRFPDRSAHDEPGRDGVGREGLRAELGLGPEHVVVGILAALRPEKDHELFLRAARLVVDEVPDARFLVVGDGERRRDLEALAGELGLAQHVVFTGYRSDVAEVLDALDVFVLTSWTIECFPMSLLEAMASRRPAVCTAVGGVPEMIEDGVTGHLVPPREVGPLAARLVDLARRPDVREAMGRAARTRVEQHFTLARSVAGAAAALVDVADDAPAPRRTEPLTLSLVMDVTAVGGVEVVSLRMFEAMDRTVVRPHLVLLRAGGPLDDDYRAAGVPVDVLDRTGRFDPTTVPRLVRALRRSGTDAVLLAHHQRASLVLARVAARLAGVPVVLVAAHDMDLAPLGLRVLPRTTVETLRQVSALVLLAPSQGTYLHDHEGVGRHPRSTTREVVVPNGIPMPPLPPADARRAARSALGLGPDAFVVGAVARLSAQKAHHVMLAAVARLVGAHPDLVLVVVGDGDRRDELQALAEELAIADHVVFTGMRRDVDALLPGFDVTCLSSVHEAAPIAVIESMAAGVPVVATAVGALPDMVEHGREGLLVPPRDPERLADALGRLADDEALRRRLGDAARARAVRDFDIEQTARSYERLVTDLVGEARGSGPDRAGRVRRG